LPPLRRRNDFGAGLVDGESDDGGFDEFREFIPNRRFNSAFSARNAANLGLQPRDRRRLLRYQGSKLVIRRTPIPGLHTKIIPQRASRMINDLTSYQRSGCISDLFSRSDVARCRS
jgi:hypothetical protein